MAFFPIRIILLAACSLLAPYMQDRLGRHLARQNQREQRVDRRQAGGGAPGSVWWMLSAGRVDEDLAMKRDAQTKIHFPDEQSTQCIHLMLMREDSIDAELIRAYWPYRDPIDTFEKNLGGYWEGLGSTMADVAAKYPAAFRPAIPRAKKSGWDSRISYE